MIITATPPGFRPMILKAAIDAGKHVFMEKPVATDPAGIRSVIESSASAESKKLAIVAGTQRRHEPVYIETIKRIHGGMIGDLVSAQCY
jgi:predicted dehydrogenase